ncbi:MAG TPA: pentapeptide repeat-containing protein [Candidatus Saccharimonadales bacterium]|nr:pentapeptide repeat-containing protein [Candidatus Saccharimonadales bacterium]
MSKVATSWGFIKTHIKLLVVLGLGVAIGGAGTAVVMASVPDSPSGVIHACYRSNGLAANGTVRIIDSPTQSCNGNETAISWNSATPGQFVTNLVGADFTNTSLAYRNFAGTDIHNATLYDTALRGGNFSGTNFSNATLSGTLDLQNANLSNTNFSNTTWGGFVISADLRTASLNGATLGSDFTASNFQSVDFRTVLLSGAEFDHSNLSGSNFSGTHNGQFGAATNTSFANANFSNATLHDVYWDFSVIATNVNFSGASIADSNFTNINLSSANVTGVTWSNTICPDGTNSDNNGNTCIGHLVP